jgi:hypothetical protein
MRLASLRLVQVRLGSGWLGPPSGPVIPRRQNKAESARTGDEANAVVVASTAGVDLIFEFEDKTVQPAKISFRAATRAANGPT